MNESGDDQITRKQCHACGCMNDVAATRCMRCGRSLAFRHESRTFPAMGKTLEALLDFTGVLLDDEGLKLVTDGRELVKKFARWQTDPPQDDVRNAALAEAEAISEALRAYRARLP